MKWAGWGCDSRDGKKFFEPGAESGVSTVAFSPDGKSLATAGQNGSTCLWRINGPAAFLTSIGAPGHGCQ